MQSMDYRTNLQVEDKLDAPCFTLKDCIISEKEVVYTGTCSLEIYDLQYPLYSGVLSTIEHHECIVRSPSVAVLLYDPYEDSVLMLEQFRIGSLHAMAGPWMMEIISSVVNEGEELLEVAEREVKNQSGCEIMDAELICDYLMSPSNSTEHVTLYVGGVDVSIINSPVHISYAKKDIWVQVYPREDMLRAMNEGYISSSTTIIALQWLALNYKRLQDKWQ